MNLQQIVNRRTGELHSSTRLEILTSIGAALFFVGVIAWRFVPTHDRLLELGFAAIAVWVVAALYRLRSWIRSNDASRRSAVAATGLEYYRQELQQRRDHLRNAWLWHGPLFLACLILIAILPGSGFERMRNVSPLIVLLVAWAGFGFVRRLRQAKKLQREIDELRDAAQ